MDKVLINNRISLLLLFLFTFNFVAFSQLTEDFSDQDLSHNPLWGGDLYDFITNEHLQLQLNAAVAGESFLVTSSQAIENATWEFFISFDFNPSSQNFAKIYLSSNTGDLTVEKNGYYILMGGSNDEISLFKEDGAEVDKIIAGRSGTLNKAHSKCKVRATRSSEGLWQLWSAVEDTSNFIKEGEVLDLTFRSSSYFGVYFQYTTTRRNNFYFDDLKIFGASFRDTIPPEVLNVELLSANQLLLKFSEPVVVNNLADLDGFSLSPDVGNPEKLMTGIDSMELELQFKTSMKSGRAYDLEITNLSDTAGNLLTYKKYPFTVFIPVQVEFRDVVINELMIDPTPAVGLPEVEYIELYNNSSKAFDLKGWTVSDDQRTGTLSASILQPEEYMLLCSQADSSALSKYGKICVVNGFPTLNNDKDDLHLEDGSKFLVDKVFYNDAWYKSSIRSAGGYSLEMIDFNNPCSTEENWKASENQDGGTPGQVNSVKASKPDRIGPRLISVFPTADSLILTFNEALDPKSIDETEYYLNDALIKPHHSLDSRSLIVILNLPFQIYPDIEYRLEVRKIKDCNGNLIENTSDKATFKLPKKADKMDLVINEILFNPRTGGADFVEIYNNASKYIDLRNWRIANIVTEKETGLPLISNRNSLVNEHYLFAPGKFVAVTNNIADIHKNYPGSQGEAMLEIPVLPSFPNESGYVIILDNENNVIDSVYYHEDFHSPIIKDVDGVSLERISYDNASNDPSNWTSASSMADFATPGAENSQRRNSGLSTTKFDIAPKVVVPNGSGTDDFAIIEYQMGIQSYIGSVYVYDISGRIVSALVENESFSSSGFFRFDAVDEHGEFLKIGIYMIYIELFELGGHVEVFKLPIAVGKNF